MSMKRFGILTVAICVVLLFIGSASAAVLVNATPETYGISSTTIVSCDGMVTDCTDYTLEHSNQFLDGAPLKSGEVYGASSYRSYIVTLKGDTSLEKTAKFNDKNQITDGKNVDVTTLLTFESDGGVAVGEESIAQFNTGQAGKVAGTGYMCVFNSAVDKKIAPFNELSIMGSKFNVDNIDMSTKASSTNTASVIEVPSKTSYVISAEGSGDISAYMSVFAQDGRGDGTYVVTPATTITQVVTPVKEDKEEHKFYTSNKKPSNKPLKTITIDVPAVISPITPSAETFYHDYTSASGNFVFYKSMGYTSGIV